MYLFFLLLLPYVCVCLQLPSSFEKCSLKNANVNECLRKATENAISRLDKPIEEIGLPSLESLVIPKLVIPRGKNVVDFQQNYENFTVFGLTRITVSKFIFEVFNKTIEMECYFPEIKHEFEYDFRGRILNVSFYGKGPGTIIEDDVKYSLTFHLEEYERNKTKHLKVVSTKFALLPKFIKFNFQNLFDGDREKGEKINKLFNDNYIQVFMEVRVSYQNFFAKIYGDLFNNLLDKVPVSEVFYGY